MNKHDSIKNSLEKADDETLKRLIITATTAMGMSEEKRTALINDIPRLRRLLAETDDARLSAFIASLGTKDASEALKRINKEK